MATSDDQLSVSFAAYANGIQDAYHQVQALMDAGKHRMASEMFDVLVTNQQNMATKLRALVGLQ